MTTPASGSKPHAAATTLSACHEGLAWPSIYLAAGVVAVFSLTVVLAVMEVIPLWLGLIVNSIALVYAFVPLHDASHGSIAGKDRDKMWVNHLVGFFTGLLLLYEYRAYSHLHTLHHRFPNDPENDPDYWAKAKTPLGILFRNATIVTYFQYFFIDRVVLRPEQPGNLRLAAWTLSFFALVLYFFYWCIVNGFGWHLLFLWILPLHIAAALLALGIAHLLHTDGRGRYDNTDVLVFTGKAKPLLNRLYAYQNYHLIHHLHPRIPYYRYEDAYKILEPELRANGSRIFSATLI